MTEIPLTGTNLAQGIYYKATSLQTYVPELVKSTTVNGKRTRLVDPLDKVFTDVYTN